jgi:hypothetical protein
MGFSVNGKVVEYSPPPEDEGHAVVTVCDPVLKEGGGHGVAVRPIMGRLAAAAPDTMRNSLRFIRFAPLSRHSG